MSEMLVLCFLVTEFGNVSCALYLPAALDLPGVTFILGTSGDSTYNGGGREEFVHPGDESHHAVASVGELERADIAEHSKRPLGMIDMEPKFSLSQFLYT